MYTKQSLTKVFLIAIALFVFWGGMAEAKDSSPKRAVVFGTSSPLLPMSTVDVLGQHRWLRVSAVHSSYLGESLKKASSFNPGYGRAAAADAYRIALTQGAYWLEFEPPRLSDRTYLLRVGDVEPKEQKGEKPPLSGRVAGEILAGVAGGIAGGIAGLIIGSSFGEHGSDIGAAIGFFIGSSFSSAVSVYVVGNMGDETGSFLATLGGSILGVGIGVGIGIATGTLGIYSVPVGTSIGATIGFNLTRRYDKPAASETAISVRHLRDYMKQQGVDDGSR